MINGCIGDELDMAIDIVVKGCGTIPYHSDGAEETIEYPSSRAPYRTST